MIHELKCFPEYFQDIIDGKKTFEIRLHDRPYQVGDLLALNEYLPDTDSYTDRSCVVIIDYMLNDATYCKTGFVVLTLEDIARMTERGIYELSTWVAGLKALPKPKDIPNCFFFLGFNDIPTSEELKKRYKQLAKTNHPDVGGNSEYFISIQKSFESAQKILKEREQG